MFPLYPSPIFLTRELLVRRVKKLLERTAEFALSHRTRHAIHLTRRPKGSIEEGGKEVIV
jgi:hypothetical protein